MFESWGGGIRELCERGFMHYVVREKKAYIASPEFKPMPEEEAKLEIARGIEAAGLADQVTV